ncbi:MAG TPA: hypothetical protein VFN13_04805 [Rudaea sp.]|nr:hypothetical protein [Rudaea sp.]
MDAFSYLSVLLSIVLGLAITQILQGFRGLMLARAQLRNYWPSIVWAIILLMIVVQSWWAMFELREFPRWTFGAFSIVLVQTIPLYLLAGLVFPDIAGAQPVDLRKHYFDNHRWFFTLLGLFVVISIAKTLVLYGHLPPSMDLAFQLVFLITSFIAALRDNESLHKFFAPIAAVLVFGYIAFLFAQLR